MATFLCGPVMYRFCYSLLYDTLMKCLPGSSRQHFVALARVQWVGLQCVIVVFPDHALFSLVSMSKCKCIEKHIGLLFLH